MQPMIAPPRPLPGRWTWRLLGIAVVIALLVFLIKGFAGSDDAGPQSAHAVPVRTVTIMQPVTGLNVTSYGGAIEVAQGSGDKVTVTEQVDYGFQGAPPTVSATISNGVLTLAAPSCGNQNCDVGFTVTVPHSVAVSAQSDGGPIDVSGATEANLDSGGGPVTVQYIQQSLTVTSEDGSIVASGAGSAYLDSGGGPVRATAIAGTLNISSESGSVNVQGADGTTIDSGGGPVSVASVQGLLTVSSDGGSIDLTGAQATNLDSGGGPVTVRSINGSLTVETSGGSLGIGGLSGPLTADTGGSPIEADGVTATTAKVETDGGTAWLRFDSAPQYVQVTTGGGDAVLILPGGPYLLNADPSDGPQTVTVPVSPTSDRAISISTSGGQLQVKPGS